VITDLKLIALNYLKGWFFIDAVSIFPFQIFFDDPENGMFTKLIRLARLPRLLKLFDVNRVSQTIKSFSSKGGDNAQSIV